MKIRNAWAFALASLCLPSVASAQHDHTQMAAGTTGWMWKFDAQATLNLNVQHRKPADVRQVESQNWLMLMGARNVRTTQLSLHAMASLEPFTLKDIGSPQTFQSGETFQGEPLRDHQHPHDLFMGLGATWSGAAPQGLTWSLTGAVVGEPTLGPTAFMHRVSSEGNPTAPLAHHTLDSTHITHGVVSGGITKDEITIETSVFHGGEPDENRLDIEMGALDSYAGRMWWKRGPWAAQISAGHLVAPEASEPGDLNRYTASIEYQGATNWKPVSFALAVGMNQHPGRDSHHGSEYAALADVAWRVRPRDLVYTRAELVDKELLHARVGALTLGYQRRLTAGRHGSLGLGGDVTVYRIPTAVSATYGRPVAAHVFLILKSTY